MFITRSDRAQELEQELDNCEIDLSCNNFCCVIPKLESLDAQAWRKLIGSDIGDVSDSDWSLIQSVDDLCNEAWQKYLASNPSEDDHRCLIARLESLCDETLQKYWDNPGDDNLLQTFEHLTFVCGEAQSLLNGQTESWSWEERPL